MILRLQQYEIQVIYKPGKKIPVADVLSRKYISESNQTGKTFDVQVHTVINNLPLTDAKLKEMREATRKDSQLSNVILVTKESWPEGKHYCSKESSEFWNRHCKLSALE